VPKPTFNKTLVGVVHLLPLPGSPRYGGSMDRVLERARADASAYLTGGIDTLLVENFGDVPFHADALPPETVAALTVAAREVRALGDLRLGVNALRSDGPAALAIANAAGAQFIRVNVLAGAAVTDQGLIQGCAARLLRLRRALRCEVEIWADLDVKHAAPLAPRSPLEAALDLRERALADAIIVTGARTGTPPNAALLRRLRRRLPETPWIAGSGISPANLSTYWGLADAFIVGTSLKRGGRTEEGVDPARVARLVRQRRERSRAAR
jgi:membrane complex biogenesis BtpA family protein